MAAALYTSRNDSGPNPVEIASYQRPLMTDFDFRDNRYPSLTPQRQSATLTSPPPTGSIDSAQWRNVAVSSASPAWDTSAPTMNPQTSNFKAAASDVSQSQSPSQEQPQRSTVSYSLPPDTSRRVVERYSLDGPPRNPEEEDMPRNEASRSNTQRSSRPLPTQDPTAIPSTAFNPAMPLSGAVASSSNMNGYPYSPAQIPPPASPSYNPPVSSRQRVYAQQPYITQNVTPKPVNPVFLPNNGEEVCVECAMRDQDMADVDVTSPGVWGRESDADYEDLRLKEEEEERTGIVESEGPPRPRYKGGLLTEQNLKVWLSLNPREPASRQQTLSKYVKSQRAFLEAESIARTRAMQEARQLDDRMRDTYSQLRRSAYDMGSSAAPTDDSGGVRIKPPTSPASPVIGGHERSQSREVTLLENGMIVEHVDVRKEEREARERRRKEERRARKSSRGSVFEATSMMSTHSLLPQTDSGIGLNPYTRYSDNNSTRPMSVLTAPLDSRADRPEIPRAQSQLSFSEVQSLGSLTPNRRTRFFGMMGSPWKSQDSLAPSGMSGSMVDMHVALQREENRNRFVTSPDPTARRSQLWQQTDLEQSTSRQSEDRPKKKKGFAKLWGIVTRSSKNDSNSREVNSLDRSERTDDDLPLAPPPPLSYLVNRGPGEHLGGNGRHASTPSLPSTTSPKFAVGISPPTAPSSNLPSPASSRQSGADQDSSLVKKNSGNSDDFESRSPDTGNIENIKNIYTVISEPNLRQRLSQSPTSQSPLSPVTNQSLSQSLSSRPTGSSMSREKSLPPLPGEEPVLRSNPSLIAGDARPRTVYTFDPRQLPPGSSPPHDFAPPQAPFRTADMRRQSFNGLASRPNLDGIMTMSMNGKTVPVAGFGANYDEFGSSTRSLRLGVKDFSPNRFSTSPAPQTKRKSRFGLSALLGRKNSAEKEVVFEKHPFPQAPSDLQDDVMTNYATSTSRHSGFSAAPGPRMSVTSRKALEELVQQDPEFVAYRYPSNDQRLDLLR